MNREQRRKLARKINKMDESTQKVNIFRALLTMDVNDMHSSIREFSPIIADSISTFILPKTLKTLAAATQSINDQMSFNDSVTWTLMICKEQIIYIEKYLRYKAEYEKMLLSCEYSMAKSMIYRIINECGMSLWACGQLLILEECTDGLEGNKKLLGSYLNYTKRNTIVSTLLEFMSYMAEESTSLNNYKEKTDKFLKLFEDEIVNTYFSYKLKMQDIGFSEYFKIVLQVDCQLSLIDLYNSYVDILQRTVVSGYDFKDGLIGEIAELNEMVNDFRINNLLVYLGENNKLNFDESVLSIIEMYTCGDYHNALVSLKVYLNDNPSDYQMWILMIKCHIYLGTKPETDYSIIQDLFSLYSIDDSCLSSQGRLHNALKKYSSTTWHYKLLNTTKRKLKYAGNIDDYIAISLMNEHHVTPRFVSMLPNEEIRHMLMNNLYPKMPNTVSLFISHELKDSQDANHTLYRCYLFNADSLYEQGMYDDAEEILDKIKELEIYNNNSYIKEKVIRRLFSVYSITNQMKKAISIIVDTYFEDENLIKRNNLVPIIERIKSITYKDIYRMIEYPIFVYISNKLDVKEQRIAFSNYLDANGVRTQTDLLELVAIDEKKNIFFMEKISTLNVVKRHVRLAKGAAAAAEIRITILQQLLRINPSLKNEYLAEISSITTKREINNRVRQMSQHKIKVDVDKIKEEKNDLFEENFQKYLLIKSFNSDLTGYDVTDSSNIDSIKQIVSSMNEEIRRNTQYSQAILALKDFVTDVEYEFLRNEKYGLDTYLSSRIRHGYCKAQLTKELREHHLLLSTADDDSDQYDVSQYWDVKVSSEQKSDYQFIKNALSSFTHDIECKIKEIRREWIRIKINKNEVGMFDFTSFTNKALVVDRDNIVDYDVMFNTIVASLWEFTENHLRFIRKRIQEELKPFFYQKLNELEQKVKLQEDSTIRSISQEILSSITICRAKISTVITEFENFFFRDDVIYEDFTLQELATTCVGIEKQIHADFEDINHKVNVYGDKRLRGNTFSDFVEIIILLMNNAITHAGFTDMKMLDLVLNISLGYETEETAGVKETLLQSNKGWSTDNLLLLSVQNNLFEGKDINKIREKVQYIFEHAKDPQILKKYSISEGGSGIYKIYKTINYNVSVPYVILYSVEENMFILFLAVDASELIV